MTLAVTTESTSGAATSELRRARKGRFELPMFFLGIAVLCFLSGSLVAEFHLFPYSQVLSPSFHAVRAWQKRYALTSSLRETDLWRDTKFSTRGAVHYDPTKCFDGYTLYTSGHASAAFLIDMQGQLVHQWQVPFHTAWKQPPHVTHPVPEPFIHWRRAHLFRNGDLLALYEAAGDTPWGYGLIKVDRNSKVLWRFADHVHHDLQVHTYGTIYTLTHKLRETAREPVEGASHLNSILLDDILVRLSAEGHVLQRVSLLDAFAKSSFRHILTTVPGNEWDLLHTNTVKVVTPEFADHHDFASSGQVLISLRSRQALALLDLQTERIVWASCGPYRQQHDPELLDNGRILLFDNRGHAGPGGPSRIIEFDPATQAIHWSYPGNEEQPLYSLVRSKQQLLPNGNVLITESDGGRIIEVTRAGQTVWEYRNPAQLDNDPTTVAIACGAVRLGTDQCEFEFNGASQRTKQMREKSK